MYKQSAPPLRNGTHWRRYGRTAAAPVFAFGDGDDDDGFCFFNSCESSTIGRLAAFLSAFHLSQAGVPAVSISFTKMVVDDLSSIENDFFDPSSRKKKLFST